MKFSLVFINLLIYMTNTTELTLHRTLTFRFVCLTYVIYKLVSTILLVNWYISDNCLGDRQAEAVRPIIEVHFSPFHKLHVRYLSVNQFIAFTFRLEFNSHRFNRKPRNWSVKCLIYALGLYIPDRINYDWRRILTFSEFLNKY